MKELLINIIKKRVFKRIVVVVCVVTILLVGVHEYFKFFPWQKPLIYDKNKLIVVDESDEQSKKQSKDYWISTHYFADGWAVNFWDSEFDNIDADFEQIRNDGFNSVIIVVPWREFQPDVESAEMNNQALEKLRYVFERANEHDLGVILRIGYTYDNYNGEPSEGVYDRFYGLVNNSAYRDSWKIYCRSINEVATEFNNYWGAFLTWEDMWLACSRAKEVGGNNELSNDFSMQIGYSQYMHEKYSANDISDIFGEKFEEDDVVYIPEVESTAFKTFYDFYDCYLMELLDYTQSAIPNISMEVRWDDDYYAEMTPYEHYQTYSAEDAGYVAAMYGIPMGMKNNGEKVSWQKALRKTYEIMKIRASQSWPKKYYVEQFLFYDNTQGMENNAQISEEDIPEYIENSYKVLLKYTRGYGIWAYKDIRLDSVINGEFAKGLQSWEPSDESVIVAKIDGSNKCYLPEGESIEQDLTGHVNTEGDKLTVEFSTLLEDDITASVITVQVGDTKKEIQVDSNGKYELEFENCAFADLIISSDKDIYIDNIYVYNNVLTNYMYDLNGNEQLAVEAVRILNNKIKVEQ